MRNRLCLLWVLYAGCSGPPDDSSTPVDLTDEPLRELAQSLGRRMGSVVNPLIEPDPAFEPNLLREFDLIIPGNAFKPKNIHPHLDTFDFSLTDEMMDFASEHGLELHGHTLTWGKASSLPAWLTSRTDWTRPELIAVLENHIATVVGRYRGRVFAWDVVNEAFCDPAYEANCVVTAGEDGGMDGSFWYQGIGPDFIEIALEAARRADPDAMLYVNDNGWELNGSPKASKLYAYVSDLVTRGVPIDGVGIQMHWGMTMADLALPSPEWQLRLEEAAASLRANLQRFNDLGLDVRVTELDVALPDGPPCSSEQDLARQAEVFVLALRTCFEARRCPSFNLWGFTDKYSWIPEARPGYGCATIMDSNYVPKPAYHEMKTWLRSRL